MVFSESTVNFLSGTEQNLIQLLLFYIRFTFSTALNVFLIADLLLSDLLFSKYCMISVLNYISYLCIIAENYIAKENQNPGNLGFNWFWKTFVYKINAS